MFAKYFAPVGTNPVKPIFVGVQRFPVDIYHLEDLFSFPLIKQCNHDKFRFSKSSLEVLSKKVTYNTHNTPQHSLLLSFKVDTAAGDVMKAPVEALTELLVSFCNLVTGHHREDPMGNCLLAFLPGIHEIEDTFEAFDANPESVQLVKAGTLKVNTHTFLI